VTFLILGGSGIFWTVTLPIIGYADRTTVDLFWLSILFNWLIFLTGNFVSCFTGDGLTTGYLALNCLETIKLVYIDLFK
jgi:hypothetical protein